MNILPDNPEWVSINVVALYDVFMVLEHDLDEGSEISAHDWGIEVHGLAGRGIWDASDSENTVDLEVIC